MDFNCDLGEEEPTHLTEALAGELTSMNVACGIHSGSPERIRECVELARINRVKLGAHPGVSGQFGRGTTAVTPEQLVELVRDQVYRVGDVAASKGVPLHHVKLHGSLYHLSEASAPHAMAYLGLMRREFSGVRVYARAGGRVAMAGGGEGRGEVEVWPEIFADRAYLPTGLLVPRCDLGALIHDPTAVVDRVREWILESRLRTIDGTWLRIAGRTLCFHADTPRVLELVRAVKHRFP